MHYDTDVLMTFSVVLLCPSYVDCCDTECRPVSCIKVYPCTQLDSFHNRDFEALNTVGGE